MRKKVRTSWRGVIVELGAASVPGSEMIRVHNSTNYQPSLTSVIVSFRVCRFGPRGLRRRRKRRQGYGGRQGQERIGG